MLQLTLLEKLKILFDLILASPFFIFLLIFTILVFIILLDSKNYKKRQVQKYILGIYLLVFIAVIIKHHSSFISVVDYLINNVFVIFYFPNIAVYATMIIIINLIMLKSIFSNKDKIIRIVNMASYSIIMYLMLLIIYTITTESIDVYNEVSLYSNTTILSLVELSNILFLIWIILIILNKLLDFLETKGLKTKSKILPTTEKEIVTVEKEVIKEVPVEVIKEVPIEVERVVYKEKQVDMFTKEEYLVMLNILKNDYKKD